MKTSAGYLGGIEKIKTAQTQRLRSIPFRSRADAYLELYMLLKKKERLERQNNAEQLEAVLKQIRALQESLLQLEGVNPKVGKQETKETPKKSWKVMSIDY